MSTSTLKDIAKLAGVSTATASRVINGSHRGSSQVRSAVLSAVSTLRYVPNPYASQLGRASGGRNRKNGKEGAFTMDVFATPALTIIRNADSSDLKSRVLTLTDENALLKRVIAELTFELNQAKSTHRSE